MILVHGAFLISSDLLEMVDELETKVAAGAATKLSTTRAQLDAQSPTKVVSDQNADITLHFLDEHAEQPAPLTRQKERRLTFKLYINVLLLLIFTNLMLFVSEPENGRCQLKMSRETCAAHETGTLCRSTRPL